MNRIAKPDAPISREDLVRLSRDPRFRERMAALYAELDAQIAAHAPVCWNRGACCNFGRTGHKLYVTALELAYFASRDTGTEGRRDEEKRRNIEKSKSRNDASETSLHSATETSRDREQAKRLDAADCCPYQVDGLCTVREVRPVGCRVYFCQASSRWWQGPMTESWLARLKALHEEFGVPYAYVEWLTALRAVRTSDEAT